MEAKPTLTQVEIFGQTYSVRAEGEASYIQDLAAYVDRKMREVAERAPTVDAAKIAILAALNISDEFHQHRTRVQEGDPGRFALRADRLVAELDEILSAFPAPALDGHGAESNGALRGS